MLKKVLLAVSVLGAAAAILSPGAHGTPEIARKEQRSCLTCHTAVGKADLNAAGQYYKENRTLEGFPGQLPPRSGQRSGLLEIGDWMMETD